MCVCMCDEAGSRRYKHSMREICYWNGSAGAKGPACFVFVNIMYAYVYVCMYVYDASEARNGPASYVSEYIVCVYLCTYCVCMSGIYVCMCPLTSVCMHVCMMQGVCEARNRPIYIYIYTYIYIYIYIYMYIYMHVCMYVCMYDMSFLTKWSRCGP